MIARGRSACAELHPDRSVYASHERATRTSRRLGCSQRCSGRCCSGCSGCSGMLNDATCFQAVYIVCGYTDLRSGMDRLAAVIEAKTGTSPYVPGTLYLFCGRRSDRIKGLVWEGDGWLLLYKRLSESQFQWPRNAEEVRKLTKQQFRWLMEGLTITPKRSVRMVEPPEYIG